MSARAHHTHRETQHHQLASVPGSAARARDLVRAACDRWGIAASRCHDAVLIASELVSNVVEHTGSPQCELTLTLDDQTLGVAVEDRCVARWPGPVPVGPPHRGLNLVQTISISWGHHTDPSGTTVWAVLPLDEGRPE